MSGIALPNAEKTAFFRPRRLFFMVIDARTKLRHYSRV
jgi:hypothetical protein